MRVHTRNDGVADNKRVVALQRDGKHAEKRGKVALQLHM